MRLKKDVIAVLWSYNPKKIDLERHSAIIVKCVLNWGSKRATDWLFDYYGKKRVAKIASEIPLGEWDKKSIALWSLILKIHPQERKKRLPSPHFSQGAVTRQRRSAWMQGARRKKRGGVLNVR